MKYKMALSLIFFSIYTEMYVQKIFHKFQTNGIVKKSNKFCHNCRIIDFKIEEQYTHSDTPRYKVANYRWTGKHCTNR